MHERPTAGVWIQGHVFCWVVVYCYVQISGGSLTSCIGAVCPASEVVLQQLVCSCRTGSCHEPHCGLMKKHLKQTKQTNKKITIRSTNSVIKCFQVSFSGKTSWIYTVYTLHLQWSLSCEAPHSTACEYFLVSFLKQKLIIRSRSSGAQSVVRVKKLTNDHRLLRRQSQLKTPWQQ